MCEIFHNALKISSFSKYFWVVRSLKSCICVQCMGDCWCDQRCFPVWSAVMTGCHRARIRMGVYIPGGCLLKIVHRKEFPDHVVGKWLKWWLDSAEDASELSSRLSMPNDKYNHFYATKTARGVPILVLLQGHAGIYTPGNSSNYHIPHL